MKFYPVTGASADDAALREEYRSAKVIGVVRVGEERLYFRVRRRIYYIPFGDIRRCYRRVMLVPARMCCGRGNLEIENLVVDGDAGELAQVQLPGTRAAKELIKLLKIKLPDAEFSCPPKPQAGAEGDDAESAQEET